MALANTDALSFPHGRSNTRDQLRGAHDLALIHDDRADHDASARIQPPLVSCIALFAGLVIPSEVVGLEAGVLGHAGEHFRAQLLAVMEREGDIRPPLARQDAMRPRLALDDPAYPEECGQYA